MFLKALLVAIYCVQNQAMGHLLTPPQMTEQQDENKLQD